jgi:hypothetical protein
VRSPALNPTLETRYVEWDDGEITVEWQEAPCQLQLLSNMQVLNGRASSQQGCHYTLSEMQSAVIGVHLNGLFGVLFRKPRLENMAFKILEGSDLVVRNIQYGSAEYDVSCSFGDVKVSAHFTKESTLVC